MSVPLDNLCHWVESMLPAPAIIYLFCPHGSKNISDLVWLNDYDVDTVWQFPTVIVHDQEPLDWELYRAPEQYLDLWKKFNLTSPIHQIIKNYNCNFNLNSIAAIQVGNTYDQAILIHSEKNSKDLEQYQSNEFICVHYWAHAIIARDWYRFGEYDTRLQSDTQPQTKFLIYCRDWSHRREYRLKFLELLAQHGLDRVSQTSVMHVNSEDVHFSQHQFENTDFELDVPALIDQIPGNNFSSTVSADYNPNDFVNCEISVVLETVFDDSRIHLTEKTLRPIACGHPFILAAGPGALEYVRSYGFKTFAPWIDESYDQEPNSLKRLEKIIQAMQQIQNLQGQELVDFQTNTKQIAEFNKKHFFSNEFFNTVQDELKTNLDSAYRQAKKSRGKHYMELLKIIKKQKLSDQLQSRQMRSKFIRQLRQSGQDDQSTPRRDPDV